MTVEEIALLVTLGALCVLALWFAKERRFFVKIPFASPFVPISALAIFLSVLIFLFGYISPYFFYIGFLENIHSKPLLLSFSQLFSLIVTIGLYGVVLNAFNKSLLKQLFTLHESIRKSIRTIFYGLVLIFFFSSFFHMLFLLILKAFSITYQDQNALVFFQQVREQISSMIFGGICIIVLAPIAEETFFRGIIYVWLRHRLSYFGAATISSLFFALLHINPSTGASNLALVVPIFIMGLFLAYLLEKSKSLIPGIFTHSLFNLISLIFIMATTTGAE